MDERDEQDEPTQTTATGLTQLAARIGELLGEKSIDSRFGAKLLKRLEKEGKLVEEAGPAHLGKTEKAALRDALASLDRALRQSDASLLVQANAKLRSDDESVSKRRKPKKGESE